MSNNITINNIPSESMIEFYKVKQELQKAQNLEDKNSNNNQKNANKDDHTEMQSEFGVSTLNKNDGIRKSKKDHKRDYHCGCGKSYLSYPALYTHIKTKHDGKMPEGTLNSASNNNRRGRPRRNNFDLCKFGEGYLKYNNVLKNTINTYTLQLLIDYHILKWNPSNLFQKNKSSQLLSEENVWRRNKDEKIIFQPKLKNSNIYQQYILKKKDEPIMKNDEAKEKKVDDMTAIYQKMVFESDLKILEYIKDGKGSCEEYQSCFPTYKNCNNLKVEQHPLCQIIKKIHQKQFREEINSDTPIDYVMSLYLWCLCKLVNQRLYRVVCIFFRGLRECLNDFGYVLIEDFKKRNLNTNIEVILKRQDDAEENSPSNGNKEGNANGNMNGANNQQNQGNNQFNQGNSNSSSKNVYFTQIEPPQYICIIAEFFILKYLPKYVPNFDQNFAVYLMIDFCNWLNKKSLSKLKLDLQHSLIKERAIADYLNFKEFSYKSEQ